MKCDYLEQYSLTTTKDSEEKDLRGVNDLKLTEKKIRPSKFLDDSSFKICSSP